jgi:dUTP pyrophosphatase
MKVKIKKLKKDIKMPKYAHPGDVGLDLFAMEDTIILPGGHCSFFHGFALEFPVGYAAIVKDKSSFALAGMHTVGGVFDAGYRGEYNTRLVNLSDKPFTIEKGDKVSQLVIYPVAIAELEEVEELSETSRGTGAFGSTGKK